MAGLAGGNVRPTLYGHEVDLGINLWIARSVTLNVLDGHENKCGVFSIGGFLTLPSRFFFLIRKGLKERISTFCDFR